jgi:20S proteasome alpha/beta subunit
MNISIYDKTSSRKKPNPVTLIVGIKCQGGVVFASDSQHTYAGSFVRHDGVKLEVIPTANIEILVAQSGDVDSTTLCTEAMKRIAIEAKIESDNDVRKLVDNALRSVNSDIMHATCMDAEQLRRQRIENPEPFEMLIGFLINKQPYIYSVKNWMVAKKETANFVTTGSGCALANYVLKENCERIPDLNTGTVLAAYCIELSKKHDAFCGGDTQIAVSHVAPSMTPPETTISTRLYGQQRISDISKVASELELWTKKN